MLAARSEALATAAAVDGAESAEALGSAHGGWSVDSRQLAVQVHALQARIDELRQGLPSMPWWLPTGPSDRFIALGKEWAVYFRTGLVRQMDSEEAEAVARTIANTPLSADQALAGLEDVRRQLAAMTARRRTIAFAAMDLAWSEGAPIRQSHAG
jgi:hypothetical protein